MAIRAAHENDVTISLTAFEAGAGEIWTNDSGFRSVPGLRVVLPLRKG